MKKRKIVIKILFLIFATGNTYGKKLKLHDLLLKVQKDDSEIDLKRPKPFINSMQLRLSGDVSLEKNSSTRDNSNDPSRDDEEFGTGYSDSKEVTLRIKFDNIREFILKRALARNQKSRKDIISGISRGGEAKNLISLYISLKLNREKESLLKKLNAIQADKVKVLKAMSRKGSADVVDYLDAVNKLESSSLALRLHKVNLLNIVSTINSELNSNYVIKDFSTSERLISIDFIENMLKSAPSTIGLSSKLAQYEIDRIDILNKLNNQQRSKIVDFVDLSYKEGKSSSWSREDVTRDRNSSAKTDQSIGFQIGFNIPFLNSDLKSVGDSLDYVVKKKKAKKEFYELRDSFETLRVNLMSQVQGIKTLRSSKALSEAKKILRVYSRQKGTAPLRLLKLNEFIVNENIKRCEYEMELYTKFYEYIYETDKLSLQNGQLVIRG